MVRYIWMSISQLKIMRNHEPNTEPALLVRHFHTQLQFSTFYEKVQDVNHGSPGVKMNLVRPLLQVERSGLHGVQVVPGLLGEVQSGACLAAGYHVPADIQLEGMKYNMIEVALDASSQWVSPREMFWDRALGFERHARVT